MDKQLIKKAKRVNATSVYECADLIIEKHGIYRFKMPKQAVKELIADMRYAATGLDTPDISLELGAGYVLMKAKSITEKTIAV